MSPIDALKIRHGYWYLATPYSKWPAGLDDACKTAATLCGRLLLAGVNTYSPIAHSHPVSLTLEGQVDPRDHDFWLRADKPLFEAAHGLLVADFPGWRESVGVAKEIAWSRAHVKPSFLLNPQTLGWVTLL